MTRPLILGNGNLLVCLDKDARIRDFYYPYVGQENHVSSNRHLIGVWVDGNFSWVSAAEWDLSMDYLEDSLVSEMVATNNFLKVKLKINDGVHQEKSIFLRKIEVSNLSDEKREIKVFLSSHFHISESNIGDTVYYNPELESIIHYKGKRYFLVGGLFEGKSFSDYATGDADVDGKRGTFVDAEDGFLSKNPIEHGSVDATVGFNVELKKDESKKIEYWIAVGQRYGEVSKLRKYILENGLDFLLKEISDYWADWLDANPVNFYDLDDEVKKLFRQSLLIIRAQTDNHGAIIAANDTHTFRYKKDTYSYMWPRDGALVARALDRVGHHDITNRFFNFCSRVISNDGCLLHKYRPDGSLGSSWHSWLKGNKIQLPIQEDETALVLDSLWKHYNHSEGDDSTKEIYLPLIKKAGDFLANFRDKKTGLPKESYDLWEEKLGVHTFTCSTVYAGLIAAKNFAEIFGSKSDAKKYEKAANEVKNSILKYLYDDENKMFVQRIYYDDAGNMKKDKTIDVSTFYGLFEYNILDVDDDKLTKMVEKILERLWCKSACGGLCRYENDMYHRIPNSPENPWFISTMWLAEYYILKAKNVSELGKAEELLKWTTRRALRSGVLSEQLDPFSAKPLSVAPLTWSHAGFIIAVIKYLDKFEKLKK